MTSVFKWLIVNFWLWQKHGCFVSPCVLWAFFIPAKSHMRFEEESVGRKVYIITKSTLKRVRHLLLSYSNVLPLLPNIGLAHNAENQPPARQHSGIPGVYPGDMQSELHNGSCFIYSFIIKLPSLMYSNHLFTCLSVSGNTLFLSIITSIKMINDKNVNDDEFLYTYMHWLIL